MGLGLGFRFRLGFRLVFRGLGYRGLGFRVRDPFFLDPGPAFVNFIHESMRLDEIGTRAKKAEFCIKPIKS